MTVLRDLFSGLGNSRWELGRVLAAWAVFSYTAAMFGAYVKGQPLDFSAIGVGFAAVLAGAAALIWAKDTARTAAVSQQAQDTTAAASPAGTEKDPLIVAGAPPGSPAVRTTEAR